MWTKLIVIVVGDEGVVLGVAGIVRARGVAAQLRGQGAGVDPRREEHVPVDESVAEGQGQQVPLFVGHEEVRAQEAELGFAFDYIIVCVVTGSTQAGMIVGFKPDGRAGKVIGIDASGTMEQTRAQVTSIARDTAELIDLGQDIEDADIVINPDYAYPAYGEPSRETNEAIRLAARTEAMITDPVYEGKSMQGMIDLVRKGFIPSGSKVLYAHLGGAPALNGYAYTYRNG